MTVGRWSAYNSREERILSGEVCSSPFNGAQMGSIPQASHACSLRRQNTVRVWLLGSAYHSSMLVVSSRVSRVYGLWRTIILPTPNSNTPTRNGCTVYGVQSIRSSRALHWLGAAGH